MLRRLHPEQPDSFAFSAENHAWAEAQITKFPEGRQASAIIPLLWRAQEQEGWLTRPAIEHVADMLGMARIRALEVATFYFMFQLQPTGSVAHIQVCGTTSCMICGAEDLMAVCKEKIAPRPHMLSEDGKFSWEEVECLGACANAPMAQIGKDYYEDLTAERFGEMIEELRDGKVPTPGSQIGRFSSEPKGNLTSLTAHEEGRVEHNASVDLATRIGDTVKRIDGTEVPLLVPWTDKGGRSQIQPQGEAAAPDGGVRDTNLGDGGLPDDGETPGPKPAADTPADETGVTMQEADATEAARPEAGEPGEAAGHGDPSGAEIGSPGHAGAGEAPETDDADEDHDPGPAKDLGSKGGGEGTGSGDGPRAAQDDPAIAPSGDSPVAGDMPAGNAAAGTDAGNKGSEPPRLDGPRDGKADDLKQIGGIGPTIEKRLHAFGIYHLDQIAAWTAAEMVWIDDHLNFAGRVERENWTGQASDLLAGRDSEA
ncbi:NADH-quinone oxidoreductase subunit E [Tropicimonas sp. IMCC34011]|uniref:NADH-quinone oxidoreductase subunit E n=1 Tax=Tropicimonas sp. IMCC34011 TaxID=2248759 RepID=UPI000E2693E6|nr:NADH-quinone oxidoreductase subunit E [Tropicimonas sp. IMCC34011]